MAASDWVRDEAHFEQLIDRRFEEGGPVLIAAKIDDQPGTAQTPRDPMLIRHRFMQGLGTGRGRSVGVRQGGQGHARRAVPEPLHPGKPPPA
jgi:hypothetical protein